MTKTVNKRNSEPHFFIITECGSESVKLFGKTEINKKTLAIIIVIFDLISLTSLIVMYSIVSYFSKDFSDGYDLDTVESRDFTVLIKDFSDHTEVPDYNNKLEIKKISARQSRLFQGSNRRLLGSPSKSG